MRTLCILATDTDTLERALKLWDESKPIAGTLAARYLTDIRKLDLAALSADIDAVLRFHPRCPFGGNGARHPCLLALFRDVESDAPAGIHRIGLTADANKIKRLTLGRWPSPRAIKLWPVTHKLAIGAESRPVKNGVIFSARRTCRELKQRESAALPRPQHKTPLRRSRIISHKTDGAV